MTRWGIAIAMHGRCWLTRQLKASTMFVNPRGQDWFTSPDRKQDLCSTNQYAFRLLPLCSTNPGTLLYQSNMTLMCFYSCLTQLVMNLLAGQEGDSAEAACPWLVREHMATCRGWCSGMSQRQWPISLQVPCWGLLRSCLLLWEK